MALRDLSKTFSELESDEVSLESSFPTDLTMSPDHHPDHAHDYEIGLMNMEGGEPMGLARGDKRSKTVTKQQLERKQLLHNIQVLKIELSQKTLIMENMKAESLQKVDELEERLNDALHQKQILQARLESQLHIQKEDARRRQVITKKELEDVNRKQHELEDTNQMLLEKAGDVRKSLRNLDMTEEQYYSVRDLDEADISLRDFISIRMYAAVKPLKVELDHLKQRCKSLEEELEKTSTELLSCRDALSLERRQHGELRVKYQKVASDFTDVQQQVKSDDYKVEHFDSVKTHRDSLEQNYLELQRQHSTLDVIHQALQKEKHDLLGEITSAKQTLSLLSQDKDYLSKQVSNLTRRSDFAEDKLQHTNMHLDDAKKAREDMYEKYINSREQYKSEYDKKLEVELEQLRTKTNTEIDRLRTTTKEMYERENRNLRDARDMALSEKERSQTAEKETSSKYETLLSDYRQSQSSSDSKVSEIFNELKLKGFESERTLLIYEETVHKLKESQVDVEKLQKKLEVLTGEYYTLQTTHERKMAEMEGQLSEKRDKLLSYEKLEQELDDVVMQAADVESDSDAEKVLFSYGYGANVPSNARRRLKHSVHLARRVLQLERTNTSLRQEIDRQTKCGQEISEELKSANSLLEQAQQPYSYLIESIRVRDIQTQTQKNYTETLEQQVKKLEQQNAELAKVKNQMSLDLERLLNQKEELTMMKKVLMNMYGQDQESSQLTSRGAAMSKSSSSSMFMSAPPSNLHKPEPQHFVKEVPRWAKKLKQKAISEKSQYSNEYGSAI